MAPRRGWLLGTALVGTAGVYVVVVVLTALLACGVSGCGGGGFGPVFAPVSAQVGLLAAGVSLVPLVLFLLQGRPLGYRAAGVVGAMVVGSALAMIMLGLGPNGCPRGQSQATTGSEGISPGSLTCSSDRDAVPPR